MRQCRRTREDVQQTMEDVARLTRAGYCGEVVAYRLGMSRRSVERYLARIRKNQLTGELI